MSITEHCAQTCAAAEKDNEDKETQLSCLLHDVGHLLGLEADNPMGMDGCGTPDHESIGADFLGHLGFSEMVSVVSLHHVNAKRYHCHRTPGYFEKLTPASKTTLDFQGGIMSEEECVEVEIDPLWPTVLRMRTYDEAGKDPSIRERAPREYEDVMLKNVKDSALGDARRFPTSPYARTYVLSSEQSMRVCGKGDEHYTGFLVLRNAWNDVNKLENCNGKDNAVVADIVRQVFELNKQQDPVFIRVQKETGVVEIRRDEFTNGDEGFASMVFEC